MALYRGRPYWNYPRSRWIPGKTTNAYTLTADSTTYTLSGTDVSLLYSARSVVAGSGTYTVDGQTVSLYYSKLVPIGGGTYTLSGTDASLLWNHVIPAAGSTYSLTGTDASLVLTEVVSTGSGSYTLTGTAATLDYNRAVGAGSGSYSIAGSSMSPLVGHSLSAVQGTYTLTGTSVTLIYAGAIVFTVDPGSYVISGDINTQLQRTTIFTPIEAGSYILSGTNATTLYQPLIIAEPGNYEVLGQDVTLSTDSFNHYTLSANSGSYIVSGSAANLVYNHLVASAGSYLISGKSVTLRGPGGHGKSGHHRLVASNLIEKPRINWQIGYDGVYHQAKEQKFTLEQTVASLKKRVEKEPNNTELLKNISDNQSQIDFLKNLISEITKLIKEAEPFEAKQFDLTDEPESEEEMMNFLKEEREKVIKKKRKIEKVVEYLVRTGRI